MSKVSCNICIDDKDVNDFVKCNKCNFESCSECTKKYIFNKHDLASCMNCSEYFDITFMVSTFGKSFVWGSSKKTYKKHMEDVFFDQQKSMIPATKIKMQDIEYSKKLEAEIKEATKKLEDLKFKLRILKDELSGNPKKEIEESSGILCPCPESSCKGYISSRTKKCKTCNIEICNLCEETKKENIDHVCKEDIIESIKKTKKCPNCFTRIQKSEGCHQMYCILCDTFFDWTTGKKTTDLRFTHNPEHAEMVRKGLVTQRNTGTNNFERSYYSRYPHSMREIYRLTIEVKQDIQRKSDKNPMMKKMEEYRISFIKNEITDDEFKKNVQRIYKKINKDSETNVVRMNFCDFVYKTLSDLYKLTTDNYYDNEYMWKSVQFNDAYKDIINGFAKCNKELELIGEKYNNESPHFSTRIKNMTIMPYEEIVIFY